MLSLQSRYECVSFSHITFVLAGSNLGFDRKDLRGMGLRKHFLIYFNQKLSNYQIDTLETCQSIFVSFPAGITALITYIIEKKQELKIMCSLFLLCERFGKDQTSHAFE